MRSERLFRAARAVLLPLLLSRSALALDPRKAITQYVHEAWKVHEGLPDASILRMHQTRDGYLWLGTAQGLARFDGVRFTVFSWRNVPAIEDDVIQSLLETRDGRLLIGTVSLGLVARKDGAFVSLSAGLRQAAKDAGKHGGKYAYGVMSLCEDREGSLWIGTWGAGLFRLRAGRFTSCSTKDGVADDRVNGLHEDRDGNLWIATNSKGLSRFRDGRFTAFTKGDGLAGDSVNSVTEGRDGSLWVGTDSGLSVLRDGRFTTFTTKDGLSSDLISTVVEDRDGNIWVGTQDAGVNRLRGGRFTSFRSSDGLTNDGAWRLLEDREGSLWIGTDAGLNRLRDGKLTLFTTRDGLAADQVSRLLVDREGTLWIGSLGGGLSRLRDGRFTTLTTKDGLSSDVVPLLAEDRDGSLWVATARGGGVDALQRLRGGKVEVLTRKDGLPSDDGIVEILGGREGNLWIGTRKGIHSYRDGVFTPLRREGVPPGWYDYAWPYAEASGGGLWVSAGDHLGRLKDGALTLVTTAAGDPVARPSCLREDRDGVLWLGSRRGLRRLSGGILTSYTPDQGLTDQWVFDVHVDGRGDLWLLSSQGLIRVSTRELNAVAEGRLERVSASAYCAEDGLGEARGANFTFASTPDGRIWFPTTKGLGVVDPEHATNPIPPPVVVEEVLVDGTLAERPANGASLLVPPGSGKLEIRYTGLSLVVPSRVRFRYRLEGYDRDWVDAGTDRVAHYTNLPPRRYTFRVIACNDDGLWNETGASLAVALLPRFWQTWWFRGLEGVAGLGVLSGLLLLQRRRLRTAADHRRKTEELEQARRVQLALLPKEPLTVGGFTVAGRMETASEVGGDYYGYLEVGGRLCVVIGDATGHGMAAGLVAGMLKSALAALSRTEVSGHGTSRWLADLNDALRASISRKGLGVCVGIALVDVESGALELGMAGIPNPFLVSASGTVERLQLAGTPLGYVKKIIAATATRTLAPGDRLIFLTDGLVEQTNAAGEEWGYAGVEAALAGMNASRSSPEEVAERLLAACERHGAGQPRTDDRTVLVSARRPSLEESSR